MKINSIYKFGGTEHTGKCHYLQCNIWSTKWSSLWLKNPFWVSDTTNARVHPNATKRDERSCFWALKCLNYLPGSQDYVNYLNFELSYILGKISDPSKLNLTGSPFVNTDWCYVRNCLSGPQFINVWVTFGQEAGRDRKSQWGFYVTSMSSHPWYKLWQYWHRLHSLTSGFREIRLVGAT